MKVKIPPLEIFKIINDPIHGYIPLSRLEYEIIQHPVFNRLHNLKQLSMTYLVFPGAVSTRFPHVLGAMFLASKITYQLIQTMEEETFLALFPKAIDENKRLGIVQVVRLAALLHDLGHGPFSHATEDVMRASLVKDYPDEFKRAVELLNAKEPTHVPIHEYYSYMLTKTEIKEIIDKEELRKNSEGETIPVDVSDVTSLIIKNEEHREDFCSSNGLAILRKIVSSHLDADRMDYLARDAYVTGVSYGMVDVERIIMNMFIRKDNLGKYEIAIHERALASVEDMLDARFKMYKWMVSHHMVVAANELLRTAVVSLIEAGELAIKDFYWKTFASGQVSDSFVMDKIIQNSISEDSISKGLVDRRYLPISLFKRAEDHKAFQAKISDIVGKTIGNEMFHEKFSKFFNRVTKDPILEVANNSVMLLVSRMPRSPYMALKSDEVVWICNDKTSRLSELTEVSDYFQAVNTEWQSFPSYYVSYIIPGKQKKEAVSIREQVREKVAKDIANL